MQCLPSNDPNQMDKYKCFAYPVRLKKERMRYKGGAIFLLSMLSYSMNGTLANVFDLKAYLCIVNHILINYIGSHCLSNRDYHLSVRGRRQWLDWNLFSYIGNWHNAVSHLIPGMKFNTDRTFLLCKYLCIRACLSMHVETRPCVNLWTWRAHINATSPHNPKKHRKFRRRAIFAYSQKKIVDTSIYQGLQVYLPFTWNKISGKFGKEDHWPLPTLLPLFLASPNLIGCNDQLFSILAHAFACQDTTHVHKDVKTQGFNGAILQATQIQYKVLLEV